jgi:hypothetical protein
MRGIVFVVGYSDSIKVVSPQLVGVLFVLYAKT